MRVSQTKQATPSCRHCLHFASLACALIGRNNIARHKLNLEPKKVFQTYL